MRLSPLFRATPIRLVALSVATGAVALVGLGSATIAEASPTTTAPSMTASAPATPATNTTTATTTTTTPTSATTTTGTTATTATPSTAPVTPSPGPLCPGTAVALTPIVCIPAGAGEDQPTPIGTDGFVEFAAQVVNNGSEVSDASVVITLPPGLRLESDEDDPVNRYEDWWSINSDDEGTALACASSSAGSVVTCATGSVPAGANFLVVVDLQAQDNAVAGTSASFTINLQSTPSVGAFPSTSIGATVDYVGTAHLVVHLTPTKATAVEGKSVTLVATIHNLGPNTAVDAAGIGFVSSVGVGFDEPFLITNSAPIPGLDSQTEGNSGAAFALRPLQTHIAGSRTAATRRAVTRIAVATTAATATATTAATTTAGSSINPPPSVIGYWPVGTIAPGATMSIKVIVKAESVGQAELEFNADSADVSCEDGDDPDCQNTAAAELSAVAPATTTAATTATTSATASASATTTSTASGAALPNTGFHTAPWLTCGAAAILLGLGLIMIGAPRRRTCGRHR